MDSNSKETQVDVLIVGGSTAGCVIAGRLAYADKNLKVMVIEAGPDNRDDPSVYIPGAYPKNIRNAWDNDKVTFYEDTKPNEHLHGRKASIPCANMMGGGSSVNEMNYMRAAASDFDSLGHDEWKSEKILSLMKRLENFQKPTNDSDLHGFRGPISVSNGRVGPLHSDFLRASLNAGIPLRDDLEDMKTAHGAQIQGKLIDKATGRRSDAASAYVHAVMDEQDNLQIRNNCRVSRIIFEGKKAVGAAFIPARRILSDREEKSGGSRGDNKDQDKDQKDEKDEKERVRSQETIVRAKIVIVAAGAIGTPLILQRSGVGKQDILKKHGIDVVCDLPSVGENLRDHLEISSLYRVSQETPTADNFLRGMHNAQHDLIQQFMTSPQSAFLATNFCEVQLKLRPSESERKNLGQGFQKQWDTMFDKNRDRPLVGVACVSGAIDDHTLLPPGKYFAMRMESMYPVSQGKVHIRSINPNKAPFLESGFLQEKQDAEPLVWAYKKTREIARRTDAYRGELTSHHPRFKASSQAAAQEIPYSTAKQILPDGLTTGLQFGAQDDRLFEGELIDERLPIIKYTEEDDKCIREWVEERVGSAGFTMGTCAMKPKDKGGCVDKNLNVYGLEGIKVADMSIMTTMGSGTSAITLLIGEMCAEIVAKELGHKIRTPHLRNPELTGPERDVRGGGKGRNDKREDEDEEYVQ